MKMKNKIIIKIRGGLGNQLFQYAYALKVQDLFPEKDIIVDAGYFERTHIRGLELNQLKLSKDIKWAENKYFIFDFLYLGYRAARRLTRGKSDCLWNFVRKYGYLFCDKTLDYDLKSRNCNNFFLAGYFQEAKEISAVRDYLRDGILPQNGLSENAVFYQRMIGKNDCIGISIRAGEDYKKFGWPMCSKEYYRSGLKEIMTADRQNKIFVFSDVIEKIRREGWFEEWNVIYVEGCSSVESLYLLSQCKNFVIANSTFSWWGAYLGDSADKKIICPQFFYANKTMKDGGLHLEGAVYLDNETGKRV